MWFLLAVIVVVVLGCLANYTIYDIDPNEKRPYQQKPNDVHKRIKGP